MGDLSLQARRITQSDEHHARPFKISTYTQTSEFVLGRATVRPHVEDGRSDWFVG
jgi:hypothetical protein